MRYLLTVVGLLGMAVGLAGQPRPAQPPRLPPDATPSDVLREWGPPRRVARQIVDRRYREQWLYEGNPPRRVEFSHVQGEKPQLLSSPAAP